MGSVPLFAHVVSEVGLVCIGLKYAAQRRRAEVERLDRGAEVASSRAAQQYLHLGRQSLDAHGRDVQLRLRVPRRAVAWKLPLPRSRRRALAHIDHAVEPLGQKPGQTLQQFTQRTFNADADVEGLFQVHVTT